MFTEKAQGLIDAAKDHAFARQKSAIDIESVLAAVGADAEAGVRLAECITSGDVTELRGRCPALARTARCSIMLDVEASLREVLVSAQKLASAEGIPDRSHPGLSNLAHLVCAIAMSRSACRLLGNVTPISEEDALRLIAAWSTTSGAGASLPDLVGRLRGLRSELMARVFGQDHAVHAFVEGLYNAEVTATADRDRKRPAAVFVFAGPPGVGKTYMSELGASCLDRPFKRFDMTGFSEHFSERLLIGFEPSYQGATPGTLTGFVEKNPNAILLFDEIEKAHLNTIQLFYQVLDAGRLEDKNLQREISFRDTIIIFTTNAGRSLYDNPNKSGIGAANSTFHRRTILSALENERNPTNGQPAFPPAICSRLGQGYPVMFNHLGVNELERVSNAELTRTEVLLERQYFKSFSHGALVPLSIVLKEGGRVDARQLRAEAEKFAKGELFKFASLYAQDHLEDVLSEIDRVRFEVANSLEELPGDVRSLFVPDDKPEVLLVTNERYRRLFPERITGIEWATACTVEEVMDVLATRDVDLVLLDLWLRNEASNIEPSSPDSAIDPQDHDYVPLSARELEQGRTILRKVHERFPEMPIYLLSLKPPASSQPREPWAIDRLMETVRIDDLNAPAFDFIVHEPHRRAIDDELFLSCVRAGGARGLVATDFVEDIGSGWERRRELFTSSLLDVTSRLFRERKVKELARERKVLSFDTTSQVTPAKRELTVHLQDFRITRAIEAADAGELVDDVQRPNVKFDDVLGASRAKERLKFLVDWLRNPKHYAALGVKPPRGYLLTGHPGTGKTLLARAVAGESNCAFLQRPGNSFVTKWQGSGSENVRALFQLARRYAPAVVFIDEIDSIGGSRTGTDNARGYEEATNALLTEMDGFGAPTQAPVIVLAATNLAASLDPALLRRFDESIEVERPDRATRLSYLERVVMARARSAVTQTAIERLAGQTAGMTVADIERIVQRAGIISARLNSPLTDATLEEAFEQIRMGDAKGTSPDPETLKRIARHEAGHTLVAWMAGESPVQVTIVGRGGAGGFMEREADEDKGLYTKGELEARIRGLMGGRAAEILYYGDHEGLSTGVSSDLERATQIARNMVCVYGMNGEFGQVAWDGFQSSKGRMVAGDGPMSHAALVAVQEIVKHGLDTAIELLRSNKDYMDALVNALMEMNRLTREDLAVILPPLQKD